MTKNKRLSELFEIEYGNKLDMNKMVPAAPDDGVAFVGRIGGLSGKSGVTGYVKPLPHTHPYPPGLITVALGGQVLSSYVQQRAFYTAQNVAVLRPLDKNMPLTYRLYYAMCIKANDFRYRAFGREANRTLGTILVPAQPPNWVLEEDLLPQLTKMTAPLTSSFQLPHGIKWSDFSLSALFNIRKGSRITKADRLPGSTRFIGASERNNGITDVADLAPQFPAGVLTVPYNGSVGYAFYQDEPFFASDDVNVLIPRHPMDKWTLLFIATVIRHERYRFTYGYKWNLERMQATTIKLPIDAAGAADYQLMSNYMKSLPFAAALEDLQ